MRPLELRLRNFRSYFGDGHVFDFRDRRLLGIVGPIGSGKSTMLDGIAFALYGRTPDIAGSTRALINQRADQAAVAFRFEVEGSVWEAARLLRRKGQSQHALYRLSSDAGDPEIVERITQEGEVNARVEQLLGLDFVGFGRSVMLAQGRFAEFLKAPPVERDKVLKGLFGHERIDTMRQVAKERARDAELEAEKLAFKAAQVAELAEVLSRKRKELAELDLHTEALEKAEPEVLALGEAATDAVRMRDRAVARRIELDDIGTRLPPGDEVAAAVASADGAVGRRDAAAAGLSTAENDLARVEKNLTQLDRERLDQAFSLAGKLDSRRAALAEAKERKEERAAAHDSALADLSARTAAVSAAEARLVAATADLEEADNEVRRREFQLHEQRHANMAASLQRELLAGEPCPVCDQLVAVLPESPQEVAVGGAESELAVATERRARQESGRTEAAGAVSATQEALVSAQRLVESAATELATADEAVAHLDRDLAEVRSQLGELLGQGDPSVLLAERQAEFRRSEEAIATARKAVEQERTRLDEAIQSEQAAARTLDALRLRIADVAARLDEEDLALGGSAEEVQAAAEQLRSGWEATVVEVRTVAELAEAIIAETGRRLSELMTRLGVEGEFAPALAITRSRADVLRGEILSDEAKVAEGEELAARRDEHIASKTRYERLTADLRDSKFVRFLLDAERSELSALGSDHFQRLSGGRYRFTEEGDFRIVDLTAADAIRRPDSLSGGETFLASLALALALAEMVARTGGRLDSFFLDEGFGTLDPEHLDLAMEGIEALVADAGSRLVVVVSHVAELRHRIDDLIVLDRNPTTGDTKVVIG